MGEERFELANISLRTLLGMLSLGQLWGVIGAVTFVIVGAFGFGVWVTEQFDVKPVSAKIVEFEKENRQLLQQMKFVELTHSYLNARVKNREDGLNTGPEVDTAGKLLANRLKAMYKDGDIRLQRAEGYEIDESVSNNHRIRFGEGRWWRIPRDVKRDFIEQLRR